MESKLAQVFVSLKSGLGEIY